jgi:serine phosphatase RsbU (regulator of sigma subunit)
MTSERWTSGTTNFWARSTEDQRVLDSYIHQHLADVDSLPTYRVEQNVDLSTAADEAALRGQLNQSLLPTDPALTYPNVSGYELAGKCVAAGAVGGGFFDWYPLTHGVHVTMAKVGGQGLAAARAAASTQAVMRADAMAADGSIGDMPALPAIPYVDAEAATTAFHAQLDPSTGSVHYVDAGQGLGLVFTADGLVRYLISEPPAVSGPTAPRPATTALSPGDMLVCVSDGFLELYPSLDVMIDDLLRCSGFASAEQAVTNIHAVARKHLAADDIIAVALRRLPD